MPTHDVDRESPLRSVLKTVSYRALGTATTAAIAWGVTGDTGHAMAIAGVEPLAKMLLYYFHERAWQRVPRGAVRALAGRASGE